MRGDGIIRARQMYSAVSIHAPRMRGDDMESMHQRVLMAVSIHAPRMRGDSAASE